METMYKADTEREYKRGDVVEITMLAIVQDNYGPDGLRVTVDPKDPTVLYANNSKQARWWSLVPKTAVRAAS